MYRRGKKDSYMRREGCGRNVGRETVERREDQSEGDEAVYRETNRKRRMGGRNRDGLERERE